MRRATWTKRRSAALTRRNQPDQSERFVIDNVDVRDLTGNGDNSATGQLDEVAVLDRIPARHVAGCVVVLIVLTALSVRSFEESAVKHHRDLRGPKAGSTDRF